jgi:hypothetical protein
MRALLSLVIVAIAIHVSAVAHAQDNLSITLAQAAKRPGGKKRPADLARYSWRFWPRNTLHPGQIVSTDTPYGRITCRSISHSVLRECWLSPR